MSLYTVTIEVVGKRPLLMNNPASMGAASAKGAKPARKTIPTPEEEAASKVYRLPSGQLYIKSEAFRGALIKAASACGSGRRPPRCSSRPARSFPKSSARSTRRTRSGPRSRSMPSTHGVPWSNARECSAAGTHRGVGVRRARGTR